MDKVVFDIETKNTFQDIGNGDIGQLEVSVIGMYSYNNKEYYCFDEKELDKAGKIFQNSYLLIGFSSKRFDVPVLKKYFNFNIEAIPHFDILEEISKQSGRRISLDALAEANLKIKKSGHGLNAVEYYKKGEMEKLKNYCKQDVKVTKELYDLITKQGYLWLSERYNRQMTKVKIEWKEPEPPPERLL